MEFRPQSPVDVKKSEEDNRNEIGFWQRFSAMMSDGKEAISDKTLIEGTKWFARKSQELVVEIENELDANDSPYEIGDYRIRTSASRNAGMSIDIHFIKKQKFRISPEQKSNLLTITHPDSGKKFNVPRIALTGREKAKIKCPYSDDILLLDVESEKVIGIKRNK